MPKPAVVVLVLIAALGGGYAAWRAHERAVIETATQADGSLTCFGNVDVRQVDLAFRASGRLEQLLFEEGDAVKPGDLVGVLDAEPFENEMRLRETELQAARVDLDRLRAGNRPQEIAAARAAVREREATLATLKAEFDRQQSLVADGVTDHQTFDDIRARRDEAQARLESAREDLALKIEGSRQEDIAKAEATVASKEAQLQIARTNLGDTRLFSPAAGTVLTRVLEPGSIAAVGSTVLTVSLSDPVWVRAYVPEDQLGHIHPGMKAQVVTDSRPDLPYTGQVGFISPTAEFTPKNVETQELRTRLVYRFRVVVDNPDEGLRQGMPVTVHLVGAAVPASSRAEVAAHASPRP